MIRHAALAASLAAAALFAPLATSDAQAQVIQRDPGVNDRQLLPRLPVPEPRLPAEFHRERPPAPTWNSGFRNIRMLTAPSG
ncbi:MAG: hypothetical protein JJT95_12285 [Pararhodobacter sp.]|nr:hypothetical protein [Pararhodobacter sp.]